jgi:hypothetical protein
MGREERTKDNNPTIFVSYNWKRRCQISVSLDATLYYNFVKSVKKECLKNVKLFHEIFMKLFHLLSTLNIVCIYIFSFLDGFPSFDS